MARKTVKNNINDFKDRSSSPVGVVVTTQKARKPNTTKTANNTKKKGK